MTSWLALLELGRPRVRPSCNACCGEATPVAVDCVHPRGFLSLLVSSSVSDSRSNYNSHPLCDWLKRTSGGQHPTYVRLRIDGLHLRSLGDQPLAVVHRPRLGPHRPHVGPTGGVRKQAAGQPLQLEVTGLQPAGFVGALSNPPPHTPPRPTARVLRSPQAQFSKDSRGGTHRREVAKMPLMLT